MASVVKVIEILAESNDSVEDAIQNAVTRASETVDDIQEVYVSGVKAIVENNKVVRYRVTTKISFLVGGRG